MQLTAPCLKACHRVWPICVNVSLQAMLDRVSRAMAHCTHIPAPVNVSHGGSTSSRLSSTGAPVDDAHSTAESEAGGLRAAHGGRPMRRSRQHVANSDSSDSRIYFNRVLLAR